MTTEAGQRSRVVVGVDGSPASQHALLWAARECGLRGCELLIVYVAYPVGNHHEDFRAEDTGRAQSMLEASAAIASGREPAVAVSTLLLTGAVSDRLVALSETAALIVVGVDPAVARPLHGILGPVEDRVTAQAHCPVVTVNGPLQPIRRRRPMVIVGWVDSPSGRRALTAAAAEADALSGSLTVVLADPDAALGATPRDTALMTSLAGMADGHPTLLIDTVGTRDDPAEALVRYSAGSDLLVVGCHHSRDRISTRIGPVATVLIRSALCPVMLVGRAAASSPEHH